LSHNAPSAAFKRFLNISQLTINGFMLFVSLGIKGFFMKAGYRELRLSRAQNDANNLKLGIQIGSSGT